MSEEGEKKKLPGNMAELMEELRKKKLDSLDDAFSHYDSHMDSDYQKHLTTNVFGAAMDEFYNAFVKGLEENVGDDTTSLKGNDAGVKKAMVSGIKAYLKKANPEFLEKLLSKAKDEEEEYKLLTMYMDKNHPLLQTKEGVIPVSSWLEQIVKDKKKKVNDLKIHFYKSKTAIADGHLNRLNNEYERHLFGTYNDHEIAAHVEPTVKKTYEVKEPVEFANLARGKSLKIYRHVKHGEEIEDVDTYGLAPKKE